MANNINLATKFIDLLDEVYKVSAKSSALDANPDMVRMTEEANVVKIPKLALQGLGDYSKSTGAPAGDISLTWETHTFQNDRGRKFNLDKMDNLESLGVAFAHVAGEFIRTQVVPEKDAYTFAKLASATGVTAPTAATLSDTTTKAAIDTAIAALGEKEVDEASLLLYVTPTVKGYLEAELKRDLPTGVDAYGQKINYYNDIPLISVPQTRFYSAIDLNDGTTGGEEAGGYAKAATGGADVNFILMDKNAAMSITKNAVTKVIAPEVNQIIDGWTFHFRFYYDVFVLENKAGGIYVHKKAA